MAEGGEDESKISFSDDGHKASQHESHSTVSAQNDADVSDSSMIQ